MVVWRQSHLHVTPSFSKQEQQKWLCGCKRTIEMKLCRLISLSIKQEKISQVPSSSETKPFSFRPTKNYYRTEARYKAVQQGPRDHNVDLSATQDMDGPSHLFYSKHLLPFKLIKCHFVSLCFLLWETCHRSCTKVILLWWIKAYNTDFAPYSCLFNEFLDC